MFRLNIRYGHDSIHKISTSVIGNGGCADGIGNGVFGKCGRVVR
jgi:hypothetical protein